MNAVKTVMGIFVVVVLLGAVMVPVINDATSGSESSETIVIEGAKWLKMNYISDSRDFSVSYSFDGDTLTAANGAATQTGAIEDLILYADEKASIFIDGDDIVLIAQNEGETGSILLDGDITISRTAGVLTVSDSNGDHVSGDARAWAYIPDSNGKYGIFDEGVKTNAPFAAVGGFAGVYCYNNLVNFDIPLQMDSAYTDDYISSVRWAKPSANLDMDTTIPVILPGGSSILPFDPNPIDTNATDNDDTADPQALPGMGENVIMAVPTPSYTDGYWGFDVSDGIATIVSYSYSGTEAITIPITVSDGTNTYPVKILGKGQGYQIFPTQKPITSLTIPYGIERINTHAFYDARYLSGNLVIPDSVIYIGDTAFYNCKNLKNVTLPANVTTYTYTFSDCGLEGTMIIPEGVTSIKGIFSGCNKISRVVLPSTLEIIGENSFKDCTGLTGDFVIPDSVTKIEIRYSGVTSNPWSSPFLNCTGLTGTLIIPSSVSNIGAYAFSGAGFTSVVMCSDYTGSSIMFSGMTNLKQVLNLSNVEYTTTSYGLNADEVRTDIEASQYIGAVNVTIDGDNDAGPMNVLLSSIPFMVIAALVIAVAGIAIRNRLD